MNLIKGVYYLMKFNFLFKRISILSLFLISLFWFDLELAIVFFYYFILFEKIVEK